MWVVLTSIARQFSSRPGNPAQCAPVEVRVAIVVPGIAIPFGKLAVHRIAKSHLQPLQRSIERRTDPRVPDMQSDCSFPVSPCSIEIGCQPLA